ncbi:tRNA intron endonuclease [Pilobolus umbonatus]|nr:tRNA intron endonuclease [Pilobolus umbonatus]
MPYGNIVWVEQGKEDLFMFGFFGKGSLSRSQPTWLKRTLRNNTEALSLEEVTVQRRRRRRQQEEPADGLKPHELLELTGRKDMESYQLDLCEAYFLVYALNVLVIQDSQQNTLSIDQCWDIFSEADTLFPIHYAVYHYYRSIGWVPKNGMKFGVDYVLYETGASSQHAAYAIIIIPVNSHSEVEHKQWDWLLRLNRICTQVKKTLVLCYVHVPADPTQLPEYRVQEVIYKRWSPNKNRE